MSTFVAFEGFETETVDVASDRVLHFSGLTMHSSRGGVDIPAVSLTLDNKTSVVVRGTVERVRKTLNTAVDAVVRAFDIADTHMFELMQAHCVPCDEYRLTLGLVDESGSEVRSLADADPSIVEAFEWLKDRGYVELGEDGDGEHILVVRRPGEE